MKFIRVNDAMRAPTAPMAALVTQHDAQNALVERLRAQLPPTLAPHLLSATSKRRALLCVVDHHAAASKLYQNQQILLDFLSAQGAPHDEVRVSVAPGASVAVRPRVWRQMPRDAAIGLSASIQKIQSPELKQALTRLIALAQNRGG